MRRACLCATFLAIVLSVRSEVAAQSGNWHTVREFAAPEAVQAAAADERFFYAIASRQVAKYDRKSGKRMALSMGDAEHLNSGFLWKGRLLCAHSNYPQTPEQSEIKVLNPDTMELSTFRDFGNYGGSLVWVIRRKDHWWCNFARYGDVNSETFLVRFDDDWKETRRWRFPESVISHLGRYSLSGGLWFGDELLVTGHDKQELYRLRLPATGRELEFVGRQDVPFTGQGIAFDSATGGLVGISRAERKVIFVQRRGDGVLFKGGVEIPPVNRLPSTLCASDYAVEVCDLTHVRLGLAIIEPLRLNPFCWRRCFVINSSGLKKIVDPCTHE